LLAQLGYLCGETKKKNILDEVNFGGRVFFDNFLKLISLFSALDRSQALQIGDPTLADTLKKARIIISQKKKYF
jgi:hypothetical protein